MKKNDYASEGYNAVMPALAFKGADAAIKWYVNIFNAKEKMRMENPDKTIGHAEIFIGDSILFLKHLLRVLQQSIHNQRGLQDDQPCRHRTYLVRPWLS